MSIPAAALVVAVLAVLVYLNTQPNDFVRDDQRHVVGNVYLREPGILRRAFTETNWAFFGGVYYRPMMLPVFVAEWRLFGPDPRGYHAVNITLHAATSVFVFLLLLRLARSPAAAWTSALLFAVHPINTEAVNWVSAFTDPLCTLFSLLAFWIYLKSEAGPPWRRGALQFAVAVCVFCALLSKETGLVVPFVMLLYEILERRRSPRAVIRAHGWAWFGMAISLAVYLTTRQLALGALLPSSGGISMPRQVFYAGVIGLLYEYIRRLVWPVTLGSFHIVQPPAGFLAANVLAGAGILVALVFLGHWFYRRHRGTWLAVPLFLISLGLALPVSVTPLVNAFCLGERYLYLPAVAFCWLVGEGFVGLSGRWGVKPVAILLAVLLAVLSMRTVLRNYDWRDEVAFYEHELKTEGESALVRPWLVDAYVRARNFPQALTNAQATVRLMPENPAARNTLAYAFWLNNEPDKAVAEYQTAVRQAVRRGDVAAAVSALDNLAAIYLNNGRAAEAVGLSELAIRMNPASGQARRNLASALYHLGRFDEAMHQLRLAVRLDPTNAEAHAQLGELWLEAGNSEAAEQELARALALNPANQRARAALARTAH